MGHRRARVNVFRVVAAAAISAALIILAGCGASTMTQSDRGGAADSSK